MRTYNGNTVLDPTQITLNGTVISNPTEEQLILAGYLSYIPQEPIIDPAMSEITLRRYEMENAYLEATKALIILAGQSVEEGTWTKLEDVQFLSIRRAAMTNNLIEAVELLDTLLYTFPQIIRYGGSWEEIEYHPE